MKTYVITLSKAFMIGHPEAGKPTKFEEKFMCGDKIHTIRGNLPLWRKRIAEVQSGAAILSIRQWTGKPYRSKQREIAQLTAKDGVGIQHLRLTDFFRAASVEGVKVELPELARNDGLYFDDWYYWFRGYDISQPLAIIHFTKFRYR